MEQPHPRHLTRSADRMIGGVAGGLGEYFDVDPTIVRLLLALGAIFVMPLVVPVYLVLWVVMPGPEAGGSEAGAGSPPAAGSEDRSRMLAVLLIGLGALLLLREAGLPWWFGWHLVPFSWPVVLILAGVALLLARRDRAVR